MHDTTHTLASQDAVLRGAGGWNDRLQRSGEGMGGVRTRGRGCVLGMSGRVGRWNADVRDGRGGGESVSVWWCCGCADDRLGGKEDAFSIVARTAP